jgi:excisionase family DNA binding protein
MALCVGFVFMLRSVGFVPVLSCSVFYFFKWIVSYQWWIGDMMVSFVIKFLIMENPFELILDKLNTIESLLRNVRKDDKAPVAISEVLNLNQAAEYVSLSKSAIYKKTSERNIPHFKQGKKLYFKRSELDGWLTELKITTNAEIEKEATDYIIRKGKFRR